MCIVIYNTYSEDAYTMNKQSTRISGILSGELLASLIMLLIYALLIVRVS